MVQQTDSDASLVKRIASRIPDAPDDARPGREQLADVVANIAREFRPRRVILFGSRASGTPDWESDVDLMVVMETPLRPVDQAVAIRQALDLRPSFALDVLVRTPAFVEERLAEGDFFLEDVIYEGSTLYEAGDAQAN
ncbi:MAG: nucleotidyltransferase domain-containing protein [Thermomicrobiales bacterium]